jgi:uncharacterized MAPEG superfamily protein
VLTNVQSLVLSALLTWLMALAASALRAKLWTPAGLLFGIGNRDPPVPAITVVAGRADRAARNMLENLLLLVALMLAERLSGHGGSEASTGATVFFWSRLVYWPVYLAGIPYLRTVVWAVSLAGLAMIAARALG